MQTKQINGQKQNGESQERKVCQTKNQDNTA